MIKFTALGLHHHDDHDPNQPVLFRFNDPRMQARSWPPTYVADRGLGSDPRQRAQSVTISNPKSMFKILEDSASVSGLSKPKRKAGTYPNGQPSLQHSLPRIVKLMRRNIAPLRLARMCSRR